MSAIIVGIIIIIIIIIISIERVQENYHHIQQLYYHDW